MFLTQRDGGIGSVYKADNRIWYWNRGIMSLCRTELTSLKTEIVYTNKDFPGFQIFSYGDVLYITCQTTAEILKYSISTGEVIKLCCESNVDAEYYYAVKSEEKLYLIPHTAASDCAICYSMEKDEFSVDSRLRDRLQEVGGLEKEQLLYPIVCDNTLLGTIAYTKYFVSFQLQTGEFCLYQTEHSDSLYSLGCDGKKVFITQTNSPDIIVKGLEGEEKILSVNAEKQNADMLYSCVLDLDRYQAVLSRYGKQLVFIDKQTLKTKECVLYPENESRVGGSNTVACVETGMEIFVLPWRTGVIYAIDKMTWKVQEKELVYDEKQYTLMWAKNFFSDMKEKEKGLFYESSDGITLRDFCVCIVNSEGNGNERS